MVEVGVCEVNGMIEFQRMFYINELTFRCYILSELEGGLNSSDPRRFCNEKVLLGKPELRLHGTECGRSFAVT